MRTLTPRIVTEILAHEGLVTEAYRDSQGIWTWSVGITDASGHRVGRYRDNPQPLARCLEVFIWLLESRYLPPVIAALGGHDPAEHELAGALSFHYNTGAIARAEWLRRFLAGERDEARRAFMAWCRPREIVSRRRRERDLFFDARWTGDGSCLTYQVAKPAYRPVGGRRVEIRNALAELMGVPASAPAVSPGQCAVTMTHPPVTAVPLPGDDEPSSRPANWFERLFG